MRRTALPPELLRLTPRGVRPLPAAAEAYLRLGVPEVEARPSPARLDPLLLELDRSPGDGATFTVASPCRYDLGRDARFDSAHERFVVPAGFRTDLASVGRAGLLVCSLFDVDPLAMAEAAVAHDWHRARAGRDPHALRLADEVFRRVLELASGLDQREVDLAYVAVRGHAHSLVYSGAWQLLAEHAPRLALALLRRYAL